MHSEIAHLLEAQLEPCLDRTLGICLKVALSTSVIRQNKSLLPFKKP